MGSEVQLKKIFLDIPVAEAAGRIRLSDVDIYTNDFEVYVPSGNTGSIYIGDENVEGSAGVDGGYIPRATGTTTNFLASDSQTISSGDYFNLRNIYVVADTAGDDIIVQYKAIKR